MHVLHVVGARPNFMKAAPVMCALRARGAQQTLVHTGQHYDANMSDVFFTQLAMSAPGVNLEVGSGSHAKQTANIMSRFEPVVLELRPDVVLVYGDVNSTAAATLVCSKLLVRVGGGSRVAILRSNHAGRGEPLLVFPIPQFIVDKCIVGLQIGSAEATFTCFVGLACRF